MMRYKEKIRELCQEKTDLDDGDIVCLIEQAEQVMASSVFTHEDVFIDVKDAYSGQALVVFHKRPERKSSLYEKTVVGCQAYWQNEPAVIRTLQTGLPSRELSGLSQEGLSIQQTVFPIVRQQRVIGTLIVERELQPAQSPQDIYHTKDGSALQNRLALYRFILSDCIDEVVLIFNQEGQLSYCNDRADSVYRDKLGYRDQLLGLHYDNLVLDCSQFRELSKLDEIPAVEVQYGQHYFLIKRYWLMEEDALVMVYQDLTEKKQQELNLLTQQLVARETNHRVKNNLQTIVSLLRLQAKHYQETVIGQTLFTSINRVMSIAVIHDLLSSQNQDGLSLNLLLTRVADHISQSFILVPEVRLIRQLEAELDLDSNRATALALVVNELIQNSYEHAFDKKMAQAPCIRLQSGEKDGIISVEVADNGRGYDVDTCFDKSLGLTLVKRFVKHQLSGRLSTQSNDRGTRTLITFQK